MNDTSAYSWYETLEKPFFAPPAWIFGPVWSVLYVLIAISFAIILYRVVRGTLPKSIAIIVLLNIASNAAFTPLQFTLQSNALALLDILVVLITIVLLIQSVFPHARVLAYMQMPYLLWVSFATILQATITILNASDPIGTLTLVSLLGAGGAVGFLLHEVDSFRHPKVLNKRKLHFNIGSLDRIARLVIAVVLIMYSLLVGGSFLVPMIAGFTLYESFFRWCGLYAIIGRNTCPLR